MPKEYRDIDFEASRTDKNIEKTFTALASSRYKARVLPSLLAAQRCGNMYTGSLYGGLASLLTSIPSYEIFDKRISMFAYGSGCAASFFAIRVKGDTSHMTTALDLKARLAAMDVRPCQEYVDALQVSISTLCLSPLRSDLNIWFSLEQLREKNHNSSSYRPEGSVNNLWEGSYYLKEIDGKWRRSYGVHDGEYVEEAAPQTKTQEVVAPAVTRSHQNPAPSSYSAVGLLSKAIVPVAIIACIAYRRLA